MLQGEAAFITILKWGLGIFILLVALITGWLVWLNRDSEKVMLTLLPALALGTISVLVVILFGLKEEVREIEFPALFTYDRASKMPISAVYSTSYRPPSEMFASIVVSDISKTNPEFFKRGEADLGMGLYRDVALRLLFDGLFQVFSMNWDVKVSNLTLPIGNHMIFGPNEGVLKPELKTWSEVKALFPESEVLQIDRKVFDKLAVPPGTKISNNDERDSSGGIYKRVVRIYNNFVDISISITTASGMATLGMHDPLEQIPETDRNKFWTSSYLVTLRAKYNAYRSGHPDMPKYHGWVKNMFEAIENQLNSRKHWEQSREWIQISKNKPH